MAEPEIKESLQKIEAQVNQLAEAAKQEKRDFWDKVEIVSGFFSGVVIAVIGIYFTNFYGKSEEDREKRETAERVARLDEERKGEQARQIRIEAHNTRLREMETLSLFLSHFVSTNEQLRKGASYCVGEFASADFAKRLANIFDVPNVEDIIQDAARREAERRLAMQPTAIAPGTNGSSPSVPLPSLWSQNSPACATTWAALQNLGQIKETFQAAGEKQMQQLVFWDNSASAEKRRTETRALATRIDSIFRYMVGAQPEATNSITSAIDGMTAVMIGSTNTIADLAAEADRKYRFITEDDTHPSIQQGPVRRFSPAQTP